MREIRTIHTNYSMSSSSRLSYVAHGFPPAPTTSLAPGYTFRFPPTLGHGGQDAGPNVVVYVVPALFAFGLVVAFGWWYYLRRARRSRANAFDHKVTLDAEGEKDQRDPQFPPLSLLYERVLTG